MKKLIFLVGLFAGCAIGQIPAKTDLRKAFEHHEGQRRLPEYQKEFDKIDAIAKRNGLGDNFVMNERWKNYQKYAKNCPAIAEVTQVRVNKKTVDTGAFVIDLFGPSTRLGPFGQEPIRCALWVNGGVTDVLLEVDDFTDY